METNNTLRNFKGIWIPKNIYLNQNLSWTEKILLIEIDSLDNEKGCFASNKHFAKFLNVKENTISIYIKHLKELGLVEQLSFDGRVRVLKVNQELFTTTPIFIKPEIKEKENEGQLDFFINYDLKNSNTTFEKSQTPSLKKVKESNIYINNQENNPNNNKKDKSFLGINAEEQEFQEIEFEKIENQETNIQKLEIQEETKNKIEIQEKIKVEEKTEIIEKSEKEINRQIFGFGVILLNTARINDKDGRRIIGKWLKNNSKNDVLKFIKEALENKIIDPIAWVTKQLEKQREDYKQKQIEKAKEKRREFINEINKQSKPELPDSLYPELTTLMEKISKLNKWKNNGDVIIDDELLNSLNEFETKKLFESTGKNSKDYIKEKTSEITNQENKQEQTDKKEQTSNQEQTTNQYHSQNKGDTYGK